MEATSSLHRKMTRFSIWVVLLFLWTEKVSSSGGGIFDDSTDEDQQTFPSPIYVPSASSGITTSKPESSSILSSPATLHPFLFPHEHLLLNSRLGRQSSPSLPTSGEEGMSSSSTAPIIYQRPSIGRLAALQPLNPPGCTYQGNKYQHGDQVATSEPCLNCTCKKGVLLCFLKVCPSLSYHQHHILAAGGTDNNCQTIREPGQCCPVVRCESPLTTTVITTTVNEWNTPVTTVTTVPTPSSSSPQHSPTSTGSPFGKEDEQQASQSLFYANALGESGGPSTTSSQLSRVTVTAKENAIFFQTSPATSIQDSPRVVTSSPMAGDGIARIGDVLDPASLDGGCHLNGSLYAEGSAVMSSSFCEYCYCIRGKKMCIRPRCHLSIMGCLPRYSSEYACCPTSYACGISALTTESGSINNETTDPSSYSSNGFPPRNSPLSLSSVASSPSITTTTTTTASSSPTPTTSPTTSTTVASSTTTNPPPSTVYRSCKEKGKFYRLGEQMSSNKSCHNCYCSYGGVKKCRRIQCSPIMSGCVPVTPEGHCCPVEYKCTNNEAGGGGNGIINTNSGNSNLQKSSKPRMETDEVDLTGLIGDDGGATTLPPSMLMMADPVLNNAPSQPTTTGDIEPLIAETTTTPVPIISSLLTGLGSILKSAVKQHSTRKKGVLGSVEKVIIEEPPTSRGGQGDHTTIPISNISPVVGGRNSMSGSYHGENSAVDGESLGITTVAPLHSLTGNSLSGKTSTGVSDDKNILNIDNNSDAAATITTITLPQTTSSTTTPSLIQSSFATTLPHLHTEVNNNNYRRHGVEEGNHHEMFNSHKGASTSQHFTVNPTSNGHLHHSIHEKEVTPSYLHHPLPPVKRPQEEEIHDDGYHHYQHDHKKKDHENDEHHHHEEGGKLSHGENVNHPHLLLNSQPNNGKESSDNKLASPSFETLSTSSTPSTSPPLEDGGLKIQPNQLYAPVSWRNRLNNSLEERKDRVEMILDGIIHALDERVNEELPSEPRENLPPPLSPEVSHSVGVPHNGHSADQSVEINNHERVKTLLTDEATLTILSPKLPRLDDSMEGHDGQSEHGETAVSGEDDSDSFRLPPIATGYITNLQSGEQQLSHKSASSHNTKEQHNNKSHNNNHNGTKNGTSGHHIHYFTSPSSPSSDSKGQGQHLSSLSHHLPTGFGNTVGRIQVSSKIGFSNPSPSFVNSHNSHNGPQHNNHHPLLNVPHLPRPQAHRPSASFIVVGEEGGETRKGTVIDDKEDNLPGSVVEIITAKTPFLDSTPANISQSDSFLVNLSPATLKVGSSSPANSPSINLNNHNMYSMTNHGPTYHPVNQQPGQSSILKSKPSFPSFYHGGTHNQWKIVSTSHGPVNSGSGGKSPKSSDEDHPQHQNPSATGSENESASSPSNTDLTRRNGWIQPPPPPPPPPPQPIAQPQTSAEKRFRLHSDENHDEGSIDDEEEISVYTPPRVIAFTPNDGVNNKRQEDASHIPIPAPVESSSEVSTDHFLRRTGNNMAIRIPISGGGHPSVISSLIQQHQQQSIQGSSSSSQAHPSTACTTEDGIVYENGAMMPKSDPCSLCRCFYGRELCQKQRCPPPPSGDCIPETVSGACCPRFICQVKEDHRRESTTTPPSSSSEVPPPINVINDVEEDDKGSIPEASPLKQEDSSATGIATQNGQQQPSSQISPVAQSEGKEERAEKGNSGGGFFLRTRLHNLHNILSGNRETGPQGIGSGSNIPLSPISPHGFPLVPPSVHSFSGARPPFPLEPTSTSLGMNPFPQPPHAIPPPPPPGLQFPPRPNPGTFLRTPTNVFLPHPMRQPPPQQNQQGSPNQQVSNMMQNFHPPRVGPNPGQIIGPIPHNNMNSAGRHPALNQQPQASPSVSAVQHVAPPPNLSPPKQQKVKVSPLGLQQIPPPQHNVPQGAGHGGHVTVGRPSPTPPSHVPPQPMTSEVAGQHDPSSKILSSVTTNGGKKQQPAIISSNDTVSSEIPISSSTTTTTTASPTTSTTTTTMTTTTETPAHPSIANLPFSVLESVMNAATAWDSLLNEVTPGTTPSPPTSSSPQLSLLDAVDPLFPLSTPSSIQESSTPSPLLLSLGTSVMPPGQANKPIWKASTKKQLIFSTTTPSTTVMTTPSTTTVSTTTHPPPLYHRPHEESESDEVESPVGGQDDHVVRQPSPWDLIRVSGCNIYGNFYRVDESIPELSSECKKCFCSSFGVQCSRTVC